MSVYCLVSVFYPTGKEKENIEGMAEQVERVFVCDNTPGIDNSKLFKNIAGNIEYVSNKENLGLSQAFNKILKKAEYLFQDQDYIIFFDQDSKIKEDHIHTLIEIYEELTKEGCNVGCIGPVYYDVNSNTMQLPKARKKIKDSVYEVKSIITSSLLTTYGKIKNIGFWNDEVFLDLSDWDVCFRFRKNGMSCCLTTRIVLNHSLGKKGHKILWTTLNEDTPIREYYQTRDALKLLFTEYVPLKFRVRFLYTILVRPFIHFIFFSKRKERLFYIVRGYKDFVYKKTGAFRK